MTHRQLALLLFILISVFIGDRYIILITTIIIFIITSNYHGREQRFQLLFLVPGLHYMINLLLCFVDNVSIVAGIQETTNMCPGCSIEYYISKNCEYGRLNHY